MSFFFFFKYVLLAVSAIVASPEITCCLITVSRISIKTTYVYEILTDYFQQNI